MVLKVYAPSAIFIFASLFSGGPSQRKQFITIGCYRFFPLIVIFRRAMWSSKAHRKSDSCYTPGFYAAGYIVFTLTFVRSYVRSFVRVFVRSLLSVTFLEFTSKFLVKVSLSEYISLTTHQKAFIIEPWVPERVSFYTMSFCPRVDAPGWG